MGNATHIASSAISQQGPAGIFPLPLSPFEKFILWDERPRQPMTFFIELHFQSELDVQRLTASMTDTILRNPLLACRIARYQGSLCWVHDPGFRPRILTEADKPPIQDGRPRPIDLTQECGVRFWLTRHSRGAGVMGSRLLTQVHHACCDGIGTRNILLEILAGYAARQPGVDGSQFKRVWCQRDDQALLSRFDFSSVFHGPPAKKLTTWQRLKNAHYFHFQPPRPLRSRDKNSDPPRTNRPLADAAAGRDEQAAWHPLQHEVIDRETSARIFEKTRRENLTLNDVGLGLLFYTCCRWNQQLGDCHPRSRIRLMMPYDLRSRRDLRMSAANRLGFSFLGRTHTQCRDRSLLIKSVSEEIEAIRLSRLPLDFLDSLKMCDTWPGLAKWTMDRNRNMATAVLTYGGEVMRGMSKCFPVTGQARLVGNALLGSVLAAPPVRENTNISIGLCSNWGQLCMSAAWNRDEFTSADCAGFLRMYRQSWLEWRESDCRDMAFTELAP